MTPPQTPLHTSATGAPVAYLVAQFPKLSETFVLRTLEAHRDAGLVTHVFSLLPAREAAIHPGAAAFLDRTCYAPPLTTLPLALLREGLLHPVRLARATIPLLGEVLLRPRLAAEVLYLSALACAWAPRVRALRPRHLHAEFAGAPATAVRILSHLAGIPYGFTGHANDIFVDAYGLGAKLRDARYVITVTHYNKRHLEEHRPAECRGKVHVIPTGLDTGEFPDPPVRQRDEVFRIFSVGRFVEKKGFSTLIEACAELRRLGRRFECRIVGDGRLKSDYDDLIARHGLQEVVSLLPPRPNPEVLDLCRAADAFVLPCVIAADGDRDGLPHSLMEAMALGVPVVSTNIIGIPEMIKDGTNGLLVPERDPKALAAALLRLMDDPETASRLGSAGRATILADFDIRKLAARIRAVFDSV